jgi:hypothetical protein
MFEVFPDAVERHAKKEQEHKENINKWRAGTAI